MRIIFALLFLLIGSPAFAATKVKCPAYIGNSKDGTYLPAKGNYVCYSKSSGLKKAGYIPASSGSSITSFSGTSNKNTSTFSVGTTPAKFKINYSGTDLFVIWVRRASDNKSEALLANHIGSLNVTTYLYEKGTFYLEVRGDGVWSIDISK